MSNFKAPSPSEPSTPGPGPLEKILNELSIVSVFVIQGAWQLIPNIVAITSFGNTREKKPGQAEQNRRQERRSASVGAPELVWGQVRILIILFHL
jgi:hypothetical protein